MIRFTNQEDPADTEEKKSGLDFKEEMKKMKVMEEEKQMSVCLKREKSVSESTITEVKYWKGNTG